MERRNRVLLPLLLINRQLGSNWTVSFIYRLKFGVTCKLIKINKILSYIYMLNLFILNTGSALKPSFIIITIYFEAPIPFLLCKVF